MKSLNINTGAIRLAINEDENRVIEFNPYDINFVGNFYKLLEDFEIKEREFLKRLEEIEKNKKKTSFGVPANIPEGLALLEDIFDYLKEQIDLIFGKGTSEKAFGDANTLNMFEQFFDGITPYVQNARSGMINEYTGKRRHGGSSGNILR